MQRSTKNKDFKKSLHKPGTGFYIQNLLQR